MKRCWFIMSMLLAVLSARGIDFTPKYEIINNPEYPALDMPVATYNVADYGVDATGEKDCTSLVQSILDAAGGVGKMTSVHNDSKKRGWYGNPTGGVVYFPEGTYLFTSSLTIPRGVTIRGAWKEPVKGEKIKGTIFKVNPTRGAGTELEGSSFIIMQPTTMVNGIAFWYPAQKADSPTKYPPTILFGESGYWGNDYCTVQHCTFINSYTAIQFNSRNGGGCPNIFDVYGTPLSKGIVIDCLADVGRFDGLHFSPKYWAGSGMENAPSESEIAAWTYENATGFVMRRNDWSYTCNYEIENYNIGFHTQTSPSSAATQGNPNGHNYNFELKNCKTGVLVSAASNSGIMFTKVSTPGCLVGLDMPSAVIGPIQVYGCDFYGKENAIILGANASPGLMLQGSNIEGETSILNGQFTCVNTSFTKNVYVGPKARTIFVGNKFSGNGKLVNESLFECKVDNTPVNIASLPEFKQEWMDMKETRPARAALYVVTDSQFGAVPVSIFEDLSAAKDNTAAIQKALNLAGSEGGGVVYLPVGHYRVDGTLTIPTGVELKGSNDLMSAPKGNGAVLESFHGEGDENAAPFINMEKKSGLRGVTINYPRQTDPTDVKKYPYSVRGNADTYICNLSLRASYKGVDLFSNKCDNHYVDYISGHSFRNLIRVGGGSENGTISNIQCNTNVYACGDETKFGCWPNSDKMKDDAYQLKAYGQNSEELEFMVIGDSKGEILYDNFLFGCNKGIIFQKDGSKGASGVKSMGNAVDGAIETFVFNGADDDIELVNSQVVAINHNKPEEYVNTNGLSAVFVNVGKDFGHKATFFSGNFWGGGDCLITSASGTVNIYSANLATSGAKQTMLLSNNAKVNFVNVYRSKGDKLFDKMGVNEKNVSVEASVINCNNANEHLFASWNNNLSKTWDFAYNDLVLPRTGWTATAFNDVDGKSGKAALAIDGNTSTRWSTEGPQKSGQWFSINFGKSLEFNTVILDTSASANDGPQSYTIEVIEAGSTTWKEVASGENGSAVLVVSFPKVEATNIRINQKGTASGYWSIHEFNVANIDMSDITTVVSDVEYGIKLIGNTLYFDDNLAGEGSIINIFDLSGRKIYEEYANGNVHELADFGSGIFIIAVSTPDGGVKTFKIVK